MTRADPYRSYRFRLEVGGTQQGGFQTVAGLERTSTIEPFREGGINDYEHQLVTMTTYPPLTLSRGLVDTYLWDWHQNVINGTVERQTLSVVLQGETGDEVWRWIAVDAFPSKWSGSDLDAVSGGITTESVEFVHQGLTRQ